jgi:hypothetical protein
MAVTSIIGKDVPLFLSWKAKERENGQAEEVDRVQGS